jgi:GT2 family glycosyltransferase
MNHIILVCYQNLEMTKQALKSAMAQDAPDLCIMVYSNGSTDGTGEWLQSREWEDGKTEVEYVNHPVNYRPTHLINALLENTFLMDRPHHVLCMPNDVVLPPNLYSEMLRWPRGMVTASETKENPPPYMAASNAVSECTPMALLLIRKWCYDAVMAHSGYFMDEKFVHYASDCDLALRMASCGIRGLQLDTQFYHYGSATWKLAPEADKQRMLREADQDREYFKQKWGFACDAYEYGAAARDVNFRGK